MKPSPSVCKIKAIHLGEATLNFIRMDQVPIRAKYALLDLEGNACGYYEKSINWSDKALEALQAFANVLEEEGLEAIFEPAPADAATDESPSDTPQF